CHARRGWWTVDADGIADAPWGAAFEGHRHLCGGAIERPVVLHLRIGRRAHLRADACDERLYRQPAGHHHGTTDRCGGAAGIARAFPSPGVSAQWLAGRASWGEAAAQAPLGAQDDPLPERTARLFSLAASRAAGGIRPHHSALAASLQRALS